MKHYAKWPWWRSVSGFLTFAALGAATLYIAFVHIDHVLKALPLLFILACPIMHLFMHRGHGGHQHGQKSGENRDHASDPAIPGSDDVQPGEKS